MPATSDNSGHTAKVLRTFVQIRPGVRTFHIPYCPKLRTTNVRGEKMINVYLPNDSLQGTEIPFYMLWNQSETFDLIKVEYLSPATLRSLSLAPMLSHSDNKRVSSSATLGLQIPTKRCANCNMR